MPLTAHQQKAKEQIIKYFREGAKRVRLIGSAGTGKTTLASDSVKDIKQIRLNQSYNNGKIFVTAPTNKALAILMNKIDLDVEFATIHSALKLVRHIDNKTGYESFIQRRAGKYEDNSVEDCKLVILDEASMVASLIEGNGLKEDNKDYIKGYLENYNMPILYLGDNKQLPPVGESVSPVFIKDYPTVELTEIVRQGEGNPIIDLSRDLDLIYFKKPEITSDGKGYTYSNDANSIIDDLAESNGTDLVKYLAFTNNAVDNMNKAVRERRYGIPKRIEKDETLVFNKPFNEHFTNKEVKVDTVEIVTDYIDIPTEKTNIHSNMREYSGPMDRIKMKFYQINGSIRVLHEHSDTIFRLISESLKENCSKFGWAYRSRAYFQEQFADIKYNHAITVHKSQGSTYKNTIINIRDIDFCPDETTKRALLYTGITRASDLVILNNVR